MPSTARKARGMKSQALVAAFMRDRGWPFAESTGAGRSGSDVTGVPGLAVEVKARSDFSPLAWLRQAKAGASAGAVPLVVSRPVGMGEADVGAWLAFTTFRDMVDLLRGAGYGDDPQEGVQEARGGDNGGAPALGDPRPVPGPENGAQSAGGVSMRDLGLELRQLADAMHDLARRAEGRDVP